VVIVLGAARTCTNRHGRYEQWLNCPLRQGKWRWSFM